MSQHVTNLCKSVNWQIRNLTRIRRFLDQDTCANLVRTLILSRLDYCNILFNGMLQKDLYRLQKLQNKCARLVYRMPKSTHVTPLLKDLHWLRIEKRIIFKTLLYVYKPLKRKYSSSHKSGFIVPHHFVDGYCVPSFSLVSIWLISDHPGS